MYSDFEKDVYRAAWREVFLLKHNVASSRLQPAALLRIFFFAAFFFATFFFTAAFFTASSFFSSAPGSGRLLSSAARHKYQHATLRCGRHFSPKACNSFGFGSSSMRCILAKPLRTP